MTVEARRAPRIVAGEPLRLPPEGLSTGRPRAVSGDVLAAVLPGPARDRLAAGGALVVTTGQQPGLFTGPLYTVYKALSAVALARRLERERGAPVVPVFWVAGDDHDFAEANHASFLDTKGDAVRIVLRERAPQAAQSPLWRERCGLEVADALAQLRHGTPDTEFKIEVLDWLGAAYRPEANLADACAEALQALLGARGLAVFAAHAPSAKRAMSGWLLRGLDVTLDDGHTPVLIEAAAGRDRLRADGDGFVTRRSGERFSRLALERIATDEPERLSPNVTFRPAIEAALFPTVAYAAGPAELEYFPSARPLYSLLGDQVAYQMPVARWSATLVERRVEKVLERYQLEIQAFVEPPGAVESRLVREALPPEVVEAFAALRDGMDAGYERLTTLAGAIDSTLEGAVQSARHSALGGTRDVEKKLVAALKRGNETLVGQIARARAALFPGGQAQERVLTYASFAIRYGPALLDALEAEVARWAATS